MERPTKQGESPVGEKSEIFCEYPKYNGTRGILLESGETTLQG